MDLDRLKVQFNSVEFGSFLTKLAEHNVSCFVKSPQIPLRRLQFSLPNLDSTDKVLGVKYNDSLKSVSLWTSFCVIILIQMMLSMVVLDDLTTANLDDYSHH